MIDVSTETQPSKNFNAEAFAMNIARAMETSGQALAAFLRPRESSEVMDKPPSASADSSRAAAANVVVFRVPDIPQEVPISPRRALQPDAYFINHCCCAQTIVARND